ncbi:TVP38/TMEM64 family inner membrane protein YdjZ [Andreprevotia sp. IGB-42]|nr:TVP38/TMEM64 family inner membrane protein YdjZ [Andreprevotia sp. IGB-42]
MRLQPGSNCWRIAHADRASVLVDGEAYFTALRRALVEARNTIYIIGWDIDSRLNLIPEGANDGWPEPLGELLHALASKRRKLNIYILNWDYTVLFALDREWMPSYKLGWRTHRRLHFRMDSHPVFGGSHHQKIVVIDDALAFVGGLDLTHSRWDTPDHADHTLLRCNADGSGYAPFHDVQIMFDGEAARMLGDQARERWHIATGQHLHAARDLPPCPWPQHVEPDFADLDLALARTEPTMDGNEGVQEIRQLYVDAIASAKRHIYFENQYFTSGLITQELTKRLETDDGPDIVVVSRQSESGWLEEMTMGVQRARQHAKLKALDKYSRYRMYCPQVPGLCDQCVNVHSKVMIIDDDVLSIGSANLNNRSMVMDTEANIVITANGDPQIQRAIAGIRERLLGEHLGVPPEEIAAELGKALRLHTMINMLHQPEGRTLAELNPEVSAESDALVPALSMLDPEKIVPAEDLIAQFVPRETRRSLRERLAIAAMITVLFFGLAAMWRWTPLSHYLHPEALSVLAQQIRDNPLSPLIMMAVYVLGALFVFPHAVLVAATGIVFGPWLGIFYALSGTGLSAAVTYGMGRKLGRDTLRRLGGQRMNKLSARLSRQGIISVALLRQIPLGPFVMVNIICGASHIRMRDFMLGTMLGMAPGSIITVLFVHHFAEAIRRPGTMTFVVLGAIAALLVGLAFLARRYLRRSAAHRLETAEA